MRFQYRMLLLSTLLLFTAKGGKSTCEKNMEAVEPGRKCRKSCSQDIDCHSPNKRCQCDGACGMSCIGSASECDEPEAPINGVVYRSSVRWKGIALYICTNGYDMIGKNTRICHSDRAWSGSVPLCERVRCEQLRNIEHGVRVPMEAFLYEDSYEYSCMEGWRISGNARLVCRFDGSWSSSTPTCERIKCAHPGSMDGRIILPQKYIWLPSDEATVSCKESYEISEERNVTCGVNGEWSARFPTCSKISCGPVPLVEHMLDVQLGESKYFGDSYQYVGCAGGYFLRGSRNIICQANGKWSEIPRCREAAACPDFPVSQNVIETFDNDEYQNRIKWFEGYRRKFYCLPMFTLYGMPELICQEDGSWSHPPPRCTEIAPLLSKVLHGYEYLIYDDSIEYNKEEALTMCSRIGGILAEIRSRDIRHSLANLMWKNDFTTETYIGLVKKDDSWIWSDGLPTEYNYWSKFHPQRNIHHTCSVIGFRCWTLGYYYCWRSVDCRDRKTAFMCQRPF